jgi:hypothetical protein
MRYLFHNSGLVSRGFSTDALAPCRPDSTPVSEEPCRSDWPDGYLRWIRLCRRDRLYQRFRGCCGLDGLGEVDGFDETGLDADVGE